MCFKTMTAEKGEEEVGLRIVGGKDEHCRGGSEVKISTGFGDIGEGQLQ